MSWNVYFYQACPICGRSLRICVEYLGRMVACRHCRGEFLARSGHEGPQEESRAGADFAKHADELVSLLKQGEISMVTFTSSSTVLNFFANLEGRIGKEDLGRVAMACIGPVTEKTLVKNGLTARVVPERYTIPDLVEAILAYYGAQDGVQ